MKTVLVLRTKNGPFTKRAVILYLSTPKRYDLIEASAVCIQWYSITWDDIFCFEINETNNFFMTKLTFKDLLHFQRFRDSVYWDCIGFLSH